MRTRGEDIAHDAIHEGIAEYEIADAIDIAIRECVAEAKEVQQPVCREAEIERVAIALTQWRNDCNIGKPRWYELPYAIKAEYREQAKAAIAAMSKREMVDEEEHSDNCDCCHNFLRMESKCDVLLAAIREIAEPLAPSPDQSDGVPTYTMVVNDYTKRCAIARSALIQIEDGGSNA